MARVPVPRQLIARLSRSNTAAFAGKGAVVGGVTATGAYGVAKVGKAWRKQRTPFGKEVRETPEGTAWRDESGGTHFIPNISYLEAAARLNQGDGNVKDWRDLVYEGGPSDSTQKTTAVAQAFSNPLTLLAIGATVVAVLYVRGK